MNDARETCSVEEAARRLGFDKQAVYRDIRAGTCPFPVIRVGRRIRVPVAPLERLLATGSATVPHTAIERTAS